MKSNQITPVIGAGLSVWAGYPLWSNLLKELAEGKDIEKEATDLIEEECFEEAASVVQKAYSSDEFIHVLKEKYARDKLDKSIRPAYQYLLPRLFHGPIVTTNYDVSLERLFDAPWTVSPKDTYHEKEFNRRIHEHEQFLIKLHGSIEEPDFMILTKKSYDESYGDDPKNPDFKKPLPKALREAFKAAHPFFLGCGLGPDRTCSVLRACADSTGFALVELPEDTINKDDPMHPCLDKRKLHSSKLYHRLTFLESLGLEVIWYPNGKHEAVEILIEKLFDDLELFAEDKESMDYKGVENFIGRDEQIEEILEKLNDPDKSIILVHGVAGIGKTQICKAVYRKIKQDEPTFSMPFIDLVKVNSIDFFQDAIAKAYRIKIYRDTCENFLSRLIEQISISSRPGRKMIAYLDNFENFWVALTETDQHNFLDQLKQLTNAGIRFLISSQVKLPDVCTIEVHQLDYGKKTDNLSWEEYKKLDRVKLFLCVLGREADPLEQKNIMELISEIGGHPLCIWLAANQGRCCTSLSDLIDQWHNIDQHIAGDLETHDSLSKLLTLSWNGVKKNKPAMIHWLIHALAVSPLESGVLKELYARFPENISYNAWQKGTKLLYEYGLITRVTDDVEEMLQVVKKGIFKFDIQEAIEKGVLQAWETWYIDICKHASYKKKKDYIPMHDKALNYLVDCFHVMNYCLDKKYYDYVDHIYEYAMYYMQFNNTSYRHLTERIHAEMPEDLRIYNDNERKLGDFYYWNGESEKGQEAYKKSKYWQGNNPKKQADVYMNVADHCMRDNKLAEAEEKLNQAEEIIEKTNYAYGKARVMFCRGKLCQHKIEKSGHSRLEHKLQIWKIMALYKNAEKAYKSIGAYNEVAQALMAQGNIYKSLGKFKSAQTAFAEAGEIFCQERDSEGKASYLWSLGDLYIKRHKWSDACSCLEQALELFRDRNEVKIWEYATLADITLCKKRLGLIDEYEYYAKQARQIDEGFPARFKEHVYNTLEKADKCKTGRVFLFVRKGIDYIYSILPIIPYYRK